MMNLFAAAILVCFHLSGEFLSIHTVDHVHRRSQRFLVNAPKLRMWLKANDGSTFYDHDLSNFLELYRFSEDKVTMRLTWLTIHDSHGHKLHGYQQTMILPLEELRHALIGFRTKVLVDPEKIPQCKLSFSESAQAQIAKICRDPRAKRALCRGLRDSFFWRDAEEVYLVADWRDDFYFTTDGLNGGLCRHDSVVRGKDGKAYGCVKYALHT